MNEGDPSEAVYLICAGSVRVYRADTARPNRVVQLARLGVGEVIGELGPILGRLRTATVQTLEPTKVLELHVGQLGPLLKKQPALMRVVTQALRDRSGLSDAQIAMLAAETGVALVAVRAEGDTGHEASGASAGADATRPEAAPPEPGDRASLPVPAHDSELCYPKAIDCPACGVQFSTLVVHARKDQPVERSSDFHNTYTTPHDPYDYELWVCPNDLYAALPADFATLKESDRANVAHAVAAVVAEWGDTPDFNAGRSLALRQRSLDLALALYRMRQVPPLRLAAIMHRLAWCARERGDLEAEKTWLAQALEQYVKAFEESDLGGTKEELRVQYLCGELSLRLGDVPGAVTWFAQALREPTLKEHPNWERMLREQWSVARSGNGGSVV
jgi:uncharacterized protein (DUF2225 family)/CRP-like cAMP-binding protein